MSVRQTRAMQNDCMQGVFQRIIPSENDRKPSFDTRSTMMNWTSYVPNPVFGRDHEGLARTLKFGKTCQRGPLRGQR